MLAKRKALPLVRRPDRRPVESVWIRNQTLIDQSAYDLTVLNQEWNFVRTNFKHSTTSLPIRRAEAGIKEARVVNAKFTDEGIISHKLSCVIIGNPNGFSRSKNVEITPI
jgi:hypothetical protein